MTATGKPILANDPHRPVQIPSLRKTVHLVAPGWNAIGAGEPALPGIALGHNERMAFGFTIVGIDQQDLYVEKLNPQNPNQYLYRGAWKTVEIERQTDRGERPRGSPSRSSCATRCTVRSFTKTAARNRAYALRWVGSEPGTAGYLAGLARGARAELEASFWTPWSATRFPSENIVYADVDGNIGWQAAGMAPIRKNWSGLLPVPGDTGEYEWSGFRKRGAICRGSTIRRSISSPPPITTFCRPVTAVPLGYEWALPFRFQRIRRCSPAQEKFSVAISSACSRT